MSNFVVGRTVRGLPGPAESFRGGAPCLPISYAFCPAQKQPATSSTDRPFGGGDTGTSQQFWFDSLDGIVCPLSHARAVTRARRSLDRIEVDRPA